MRTLGIPALEDQEKILQRLDIKVMITAWHSCDEILGCKRHEGQEAPLHFWAISRPPADSSQRVREFRDRGRQSSWRCRVLRGDPFPCQSQEVECMDRSQGWDEVSFVDRLIVPEPTYNSCLRLLRDYWHCYFWDVRKKRWLKRSVRFKIEYLRTKMMMK